MTTAEARKALQERKDELENNYRALRENVDKTMDAGHAAVHKKYNIRRLAAFILILAGIAAIILGKSVFAGTGVMLILVGGVIIYRNINVFSFEMSKIDQSYETARNATRYTTKL